MLFLLECLKFTFVVILESRNPQVVIPTKFILTWTSKVISRKLEITVVILLLRYFYLSFYQLYLFLNVIAMLRSFLPSCKIIIKTVIDRIYFYCTHLVFFWKHCTILHRICYVSSNILRWIVHKITFMSFLYEFYYFAYMSHYNWW